MVFDIFSCITKALLLNIIKNSVSSKELDVNDDDGEEDYGEYYYEDDEGGEEDDWYDYDWENPLIPLDDTTTEETTTEETTTEDLSGIKNTKP